MVVLMAGILGAIAFAVGVGRWCQQGISLGEAALHAAIMGTAVGLAAIALAE